MATKLTNIKKREIAHDYFKQGFSQKDIASKLEVSANTLSRWATAGKWHEERRSITLSRQELLRGWQNQLLEINNIINARDEGKRYPTSGEADIQTKLTSNINKLQIETSLSGYVSVATDIVEFFQNQYPAKAKDILDYLDIFIKSKL
jgi:transposase-like protein